MLPKACKRTKLCQRSMTTIAAFTSVPDALNEPAGRSIHSVASSMNLSRCRGPLAQIATSRPPGFKCVKACSMCLMSDPRSKGEFITMRPRAHTPYRMFRILFLVSLFSLLTSQSCRIG